MKIDVRKRSLWEPGAMKYILLAEAVVCVVFCFLRIRFSDKFSVMAAFPFEQAGWTLRQLSLSGSAGNAAAVALYVLFSLTPLGVWLVLWKLKRQRRVDLVLPGLSFFLFIINYYMVNPGLFSAGVPGMGKWILGGTFYSLLFAYLVIRVLSVCRDAGTDALVQGLQGILFFLNIIFVYIIFAHCLGEALEAAVGMEGGMFAEGFLSMEEAVPMGGGVPGNGNVSVTYLFLSLRCAVRILPYAFDMGIVFLAVRLLEALGRDRYSDESVGLARRLAVFCPKALGITVLAGAAFNVLQCLFCSRLYETDIVVSVPVVSVVFVLAVFLFSRYVREDQKLKRENDLII